MKFDDLFKNIDNSIYQRLIDKKPDARIWLKIMDQYKDWNISGYNVFVSHFEMFEGKVAERIFAIHYNKKRNMLEKQEVCIRVEGMKNYYIKNLYLSGMGGYRVVWNDSRPSHYYFSSCDRDKWFPTNWRFDLFIYEYLNKPQEIDESLKYCSFDGKVNNAIDYITAYRVYPELEIVSKLGLYNCYRSIRFLEKLKKDKQFKKFVVKQKEYDKDYYINTTALERSYKQNMSVKDYNNYVIRCQKYNRVAREVYEIKKLNIKEKLINYLQDIDATEYIDFINAVIYLHLDLNEEKNVMPKDFRHWHEFYTKQVRRMKEPETYIKMEQVYNKYKKLERQVGNYSIQLAKTPDDLIHEGETLSHCVGKMGYDKKMANEESLIFFVREEKEIPLYTLELTIKGKRINQFYGEHDSQVPQNVKDLIDNKWMPKVKRFKVI